VFSRLRELRLVRDCGFSVEEARTEVQELLSHFRATDPKIGRNHQIVQMIQDEMLGGQVLEPH
jgi:hypothetical protein